MEPTTHLYLHLPFDNAPCALDARVIYDHDPSVERAYVEAMQREIGMTAQDVADTQVTSIHIGGGNPLILEAGLLEALLQKVKACFQVSKICELSLETPPHMLNAVCMVRLQHLGVTRLVMPLYTGRVSDLERFHLRGNMGTLQTALMLPQMFSFPYYAAQIMIGLPDQRAEHLLTSTKFCIKYHAPEIQFLPFVEPRNSTWKDLRITSIAPEDPASLMEPSRAHLLEKGYREYMPGKFARPGFESVCEKATQGTADYLAFGVGVTSRSEGVVYRTTRSMDVYVTFADTPEKLYTVV